MNPMGLMKIKGLFDKFNNNHPKVVMFFKNCGREIKEGSVLELTITNPDGKTMCTNMKITAEDVELFKQIKDIKG